MPEGSLLLVNRVGLESLLELPKSVQRQMLRKTRDVEAAPGNMGYPLRGSLAGFRGIHSGRYRVIWKTTSLESGENVAEVCYVGIHSQGDERDAYTESEKLFGNLGWLQPCGAGCS